MSSEVKKELRALIAKLPINSVQRLHAETGIVKLSDKRARELCEDLSKALEELPRVVRELNQAIDEYLNEDEDELDRLSIERMEGEGG